MEETTLYCHRCYCEDVPYEDVEENVHVGCGGDVEKVCADCLGTGEVTTMEMVYAGESHTAPIGTRACWCRAIDLDED